MNKSKSQTSESTADTLNGQKTYNGNYELKDAQFQSPKKQKKLASFFNEIQEYSFESFQSSFNEISQFRHYESTNFQKNIQSRNNRGMSILPVKEENDNQLKSRRTSIQIDEEEEEEEINQLNIYQVENLEGMIDEFLDQINVEQIDASNIFQERQKMIRNNLLIKLHSKTEKFNRKPKGSKSNIIERRRLQGVQIQTFQLDGLNRRTLSKIQD